MEKITWQKKNKKNKIKSSVLSFKHQTKLEILHVLFIIKMRSLKYYLIVNFISITILV